VEDRSLTKDATTITRIITQPGYRFTEGQKIEFHAAAKRMLKRLVTALGCSTGTYDLRSNKAGSACLGEVTLHTDNVYVQVCGMTVGGSSNILYRTVKSRKDYTGGSNNWARPEQLDNVTAFANTLKHLCAA